jgi:hypothetical protein
MTRRTKVTTAALLLAAATIAAPAAAAERDLDDVSADAAGGSATALACAVPAVGTYFHAALADVAARRWGAVPSTLEEEILDLAADAVYHAATRGDASGDAIEHLLRAGGPACTDARALPRKDAPLAFERCSAAPVGARRGDPACALALAARAALAGDPRESRSYLGELVVSSTFDRLYVGKTLSEEEKSSLYEGIAFGVREALLAPDERATTIDDDVERAFAGIDLDR